MEKEIDEKQIITNSLSEDSKINLKAYTWGYGKFGSLGINSFENKVVCPTILPFSLKLISYKCSIVNASAGMYSTIIVAQDGSIHGFGSNKNGRLGLQQDKENVFGIPTLIKMPNNVKIVKVSCGRNFSLALSNTGVVFSTGKNTYGELGIGNTTETYSFTRVLSDEIYIDICAGSYSLLLGDNRRLYSCGKSSLNGQVENKDFSIPEIISTLSNTEILNFHAGYTHSACVSNTGELFVWGDNNYYELGLGKDKKNRKTPTKVNILSGKCINDKKETESVFITKVSCSVGDKFTHTLCLDNNGIVYSFGSGYKGKLGHGDFLDVYTPKAIEFFIKNSIEIEEVIAGGIHSACISKQRKLFTFGCGSDGRLGHKESLKYNVLYKEVYPKEVIFEDVKFKSGVNSFYSGYYHGICLAN